MLKISATGPDPAKAGDIAQAVAEGYIENRRQAAVSGLERAAADIQDKLAPLQAQIASLDTQIAAKPPRPIPPPCSSPRSGRRPRPGPRRRRPRMTRQA